jgi:hypothetical protein
MHALYLLRASYFDATVIIPTYMGYWRPTDFMTFDPVHPNYNQPKTPGSYISRTPEISHYYQYMLAIKKLKKEPEQENLTMLAMILDFMVFNAQTLRRLLDTRPSSAAQLQAIRNIMIMSINTVDTTQDSDEFSVLCCVLRAIVYKIEPIPLPTVDLQTGLQGQQSHRKHRRSSLGEQSPFSISDIPRNKLGCLEARTRVAHANTYVPLTPPQARSSIPPPVFTLAESPVPTLRPVYVPTPQIAVFSPDDTHSHHTHTHQANLVVIQSETMLRMSSKRVTVFDSGCSISGTCNLNVLSDVTACGPMSVEGASGPSTQPTKRGKLGPLGLDAILLPGLGNQTLISLSQFCTGGDTGVQNVGVFTTGDFRMFRLDSILPAFKLIAERGQEVARGTVKEGIYVQEST